MIRKSHQITYSMWHQGSMATHENQVKSVISVVISPTCKVPNYLVNQLNHGKSHQNWIQHIAIYCILSLEVSITWRQHHFGTKSWIPSKEKLQSRSFNGISMGIFMQKCSIIIHHLKRTPLIQGSTCNARLFQAAIIGEVTCQVYEYENYDMTSPHLSSYHLGQSYMTTIDECNEYDLRVLWQHQLPVAKALRTHTSMQKHISRWQPSGECNPCHVCGKHIPSIFRIHWPVWYKHLWTLAIICNAKNTFATYCLVPASGWNTMSYIQYFTNQACFFHEIAGIINLLEWRRVTSQQFTQPHEVNPLLFV